jgi:hypothetical protein
MRLSWAFALAGLVATAWAAPALAQGSIFAVIAQGDPANGRTLAGLTAGIGFFDANGNGRADPMAPAEPVYLDLDGSRSVSYGDVRLTGYGGYPAGSTADVTNGDLTLALAAPQGWIASTPQAAWYVDVDGDRQVSAGDVRLSGAFGSHVGASDGDLRTGLRPAQQATSSLGRLGYLDADSDGTHDATEAIVFDLDASGSADAGRVTAGDLRLTPSGPGLDDGPTRAEFDQATGKSATGGSGSGSTGGVTIVDHGEASQGSGWGLPETVLLVLGLVNLAGLVVLSRRTSRPRNPFK